MNKIDILWIGYMIGYIMYHIISKYIIFDYKINNIHKREDIINIYI
jgi:hypothetical protein